MKTILLDAGHGGLINGEYQTSGKRSPTWKDGSVLYEGELNRQVKWRVMELLYNNGIPYIDINPEQSDLSLEQRVKRANDTKNSIYISIHSNAGRGTGCEVFVAENCSPTSVKIARAFEDVYRGEFPKEKWRGIKSKNFYVIKNTKMPAVLIESFFMDTESECKKILMAPEGRNRIANWIYKSIDKYLKSL